MSNIIRDQGNTNEDNKKMPFTHIQVTESKRPGRATGLPTLPVCSPSSGCPAEIQVSVHPVHCYAPRATGYRQAPGRHLLTEQRKVEDEQPEVQWDPFHSPALGCDPSPHSGPSLGPRRSRKTKPVWAPSYRLVQAMFLFIRKVTVKGNFETTITTLTQNFSFPSSFSSHVHNSHDWSVPVIFP